MAAVASSGEPLLILVPALALSVPVFFGGKQIFLPPMDEGGFVIDYITPPGTSLAETDHELRKAEAILRSVPEVESYSRRTGARLALAIADLGVLVVTLLAAVHHAIAAGG